MEFYITGVTILLWSNFTILLGLGFFLIFRKKTKGARYFAGLMLASAFWALTIAFESGSLFLNQRIFWSKLSYLGAVSVGPIWLLFTLKYSQLKKVYNKIKKSIWVIPLIAVILVFTNEYHHLIWTDFSLLGENIISGIKYHHGPAFYIHTTFSYSLLIIGLILFIRYIYSLEHIGKRAFMIVITALLFPWFGNIYYLIWGPENLGGVDLTPVSMTMTGILITFTILRYQFLSLSPIANKTIQEHLESGIIVVNKNDIIININSAAQYILGKEVITGYNINISSKRLSKPIKDFITGDNTSVFISEINRWYEISTQTIVDQKGARIGYVIFLYDITRLREIQNDLKKSEKLLADIINFLPDPTMVVDKNGKVLIWNKAIEELSGKKAEEIIGKSDYEYALPFYGEKRPFLVDLAIGNVPKSKKKQLYGNIEEKGDLLTTEVKNSYLYNGKVAYFWAMAKPIYNDKNEVIGGIETIRDVTERDASKRALSMKLKELSEVNDIMIGREIKMVDLKERIRQLELENEALTEQLES